MNFIFCTAIIMVLVSCGANRQLYAPPSKNQDTAYASSEPSPFQHFYYKDILTQDVIVQDIFQKSLLTNLAFGYPCSFGNSLSLRTVDSLGNHKGNTLKNTTDSYAYMNTLSRLFPIGNNVVDAVAGLSDNHIGTTRLPSYVWCFDVLPKYASGNFVIRDFNIDSEVIRLQKGFGYRPLRANFFNHSDTAKESGPQQVFKLHTPCTDSIYYFQPGAFLIAMPYEAIENGDYLSFHPENRFMVLNSHAFNYERHVQVFFFHFMSDRSKLREPQGQLAKEFNYFIDSVNARKDLKGIGNPYTKFIAREKLVPALEEFMHIVLSAEYGCEVKPTFSGMAGKNIYTFNFYSKVKRANMQARFDLAAIKITSVKPL